MVRPLAFVAGISVWMLATSSVLGHPSQEPSRDQALAHASAITITVDPPDVARADGSASNVRIYTSKQRGHVHIWASASELDPVLHVTDGDGSVLADDDNSGGGSTAFVSIAVQPAQVLRVRVDGAAAAAVSGGVARLSIRELPETDATDGAATDLRSALSEIQQERVEAKPEVTRAHLHEVTGDLLATPGAATSEAVHDALAALADVAMAHLDYDDAERIHRALLGFLEANHPADSVRVQREKLHLVAALNALGKSSEALALGLAAVATLERTLQPDDVDLQLARGVTADAYADLQEFERARDMYRAIMGVFDRVLPETDIRRTDVRSNLAFSLVELGELAEARDLQEQVLEVYKRVYPEDNAYRLGAENNLAGTLNALGDKQAALILHRHVLAVYLRTLPDDHFEVAAARMNVGLGLCSIGELAESQDLLEQALKGHAAHYPEDHAYVEAARVNLAFVLDKRGEFARAKSLLDKTLELHKEPLDRAPLRFWRTQFELMINRECLGDLPGAREAAEASIAIMSRCYSADSPDIIDQQNKLAGILVRLEKPEDARRKVLANARETQRFLADCGSTMPARQAEAVEASWSRLVSDGLSLLAEPALGAGDRSNLECAFALIESARGIGTNVLRCARSLGVGANRDAVDKKRALVRDTSARLARLANESEAKTDLEEALGAKERAEREVRAAIAVAMGGQVAAPDVEAKTVASALRDDEVVIGYWIYARKPASSGPNTPGVPSLLAMVLRPSSSLGGSLARIELGPLDAIEFACARWRRAIASVAASKNDSAREAGEALRKLVIDPLRERAGSARRWIVALDGALHLVPLDALPDGAGCLGDRVEIDLRPVLWDLARQHTEIARETGLLAMGGIDYDASLEAASGAAPRDTPIKTSNAKPPAPSPDSLAARNGTAAAPRFEALPETSQEVDAIAALFRDAHSKDARAEVLRGAAASKDELVARAPHSRFVHLATHGFFAPGRASIPREDPRSEDQRSASDSFSFEREVRGFAPMTLCGLALAGANETSANRGGALENTSRCVITAEELGSLDLAQCELGVLSACDTNVGERTAGQGIASFQKALHAAGARTVITSLWKVPDRAAHELMVAFYRNIWIEKLPKSQALWKAKQTLRSERAPPRDWAAWVLSGEPD